MKHSLTPKLAFYEYHTPGFPGVVLKWHEEDGKILGEYFTLQGCILPYRFRRCHGDAVDFRDELPRFDEWTRKRFGDDPKVQG